MAIPYIIILFDSEDETNHVPSTIILSDSDTKSNYAAPEYITKKEEEPEEEVPEEEEEPEEEEPEEEESEEEELEEEEPEEEEPEEEEPEEKEVESEDTHTSHVVPETSHASPNTFWTPFCGSRAHTILTARKRVAIPHRLATPAPEPAVPTTDPYLPHEFIPTAH